VVEVESGGEMALKVEMPLSLLHMPAGSDVWVGEMRCGWWCLPFAAPMRPAMPLLGSTGARMPPGMSFLICAGLVLALS